MVLNNHFDFLHSRTLVTNRQLLFCPTKFVQNFLAVLLVVSVYLLVVKKGPGVPKRMVYFRENRKEKKIDGIWAEFESIVEGSI